MTSTTRLDAAWPPAGPVPRASRPPAESFRTPVRGYAYAARPPEAPPPPAGAAARLVREPDNPRDPLAVAVWTADDLPWRIGYLDRAVAARLAPRLDAGQRFRVELAGWVEAPDARWQRPLLRVTTERPAVARPLGLWGRPPASTRRIVSPAR